MERLQKILSQAGIASRRASERLMLEGRVTVNGTTIMELGTKADPSRDDIRVDGRRIRLPERHRYLLLNKPRGYVTTRSDPQKRPTVIDLIQGAWGPTPTRTKTARSSVDSRAPQRILEYVYPVGRLDFDSEGLLLLTNDGDLAARLTHPSHGVERVYEARVLGVPDEHDLVRLRRGMVIDGRRTAPADVALITESRPRSKRYSSGRAGPHPRASSFHGSRGGPHPRSHGAAGAGLERRLSASAVGGILRITIREGRNRQVRKMLDAIGHPVDHLKRVAIGPIRDERLKPGQWRELTPEEVARLRKAAARSVPPQHKGYKGHKE